MCTRTKAPSIISACLDRSQLIGRPERERLGLHHGIHAQARPKVLRISECGKESVTELYPSHCLTPEIALVGHPKQQSSEKKSTLSVSGCSGYKNMTQDTVFITNRLTSLLRTQSHQYTNMPNPILDSSICQAMTS